jgi:hypothetical protein
MVRMIDHDEGSGWKSSARGESAWKEEREAVASRNAEVRKSGKVEREKYEKERAGARKTAAAKTQAQLLKHTKHT